MELNLSQLEMFAQICEFSTRMGVPASTSGLSDSGVPKGTILAIRSIARVAYVTSEQLEVARQVLCSIYEANRTFFDPESYYKNENKDIDVDCPVDGKWTAEDVVDAMTIGVMAAHANMTARIAGVDTPYLVLKPNNSRYTKEIPINALHLVRDIFEVVCQQNNDFAVSEQPPKGEPEED